MFRFFLPLILLVGLVPLFAACGGDDDDSSSSNPDQVSVTLKDFSLTPDKTTVPAGDVTFDIKNNGPSQHEFVVFKTDLDAANLPYDKDKFTVTEDSPGLSKVDEKEAIDPGKSTTLTATLAPGHYVLICNIPTHYGQGMRFNFTVK
ncbi:MAG: cupredoxin domain-containing protein [bacterium]